MIGCFFLSFFFFLQYTGIEMVNILKSTLSIPVQIFSKNFKAKLFICTFLYN